MKKSFKWIYLLTKRLYKKMTFLLILLLIPVIVLGIGAIARQESGFVKIALAQEDASDELSGEIINELKESSQLILYTCYDSPSAAADAVKSGKADAAWIFPKETKSRIELFTKNQNPDNYIVTVLEREENVLLKLSHEKLSGVIYKHCARTMYINYVRENVEVLYYVDDDRLMDYYESYKTGSNLFSFTLPDSETVVPVMEVDYLTAPLRGLLGIMIVVCGIAAALFYLKDEKNGVFALFRASKKPLIEAACLMVALISVGIAVIIALLFAGVAVSFFRELWIMALYVIICTLFCMLIRRLTCSIKQLATVLPLLIVSLIVVCPVFFDFDFAKSLQLLLPTTYYINSVYNNMYIYYSLIYAAFIAVLIFAFEAIKTKKILWWK